VYGERPIDVKGYQMATARRRKRSQRKLIAAATALSAINRFVLLMLENRSFDHMLGYMTGRLDLLQAIRLARRRR